MVPETEQATLGSYLRGERERKKVSLEEISAISKINVKLLAHLEDDSHEHLPKPIFIKGYLKIYSSHLGLNFNEVIARYDEQFTPKEKKKNQLSPIQSTSKKLVIPKQFPKKLYWLIFGLVTVGVIILTSTFSSKTPKVENTNTAAIPVVASNPPPTISSSEQKPLLETKTEPAVIAIPQQLTIQSKKPVWVKIQIDKHPIYTQNLVSNREIQLKGEREIKLFLSDRSAVKLIHNGKELTSLGNEPLPIYLEFNQN